MWTNEHSSTRNNERPQLFQVDLVHLRAPSVVFLRRFEDHRDAEPARVVDEVGESRLSDLALADVFVSVDAGTQVFLRVVGVDALNACHTDDTIELIDGLGVGFGGAKVVSRGEKVAGVQADAQAVGLSRAVEDSTKVFESPADVGSLSRGGFQQNLRSKPSAASMHIIEPGGDSFDALDLGVGLVHSLPLGVLIHGARFLTVAARNIVFGVSTFQRFSVLEV